MIAELGHVALVLALCMALLQSTLPLIGAQTGDEGLMAVARPAATGQFVFLCISFGCLVAVYLLNDFSVINVAQNSNTALPWWYRISATWGNHEGSMLLWVLTLAGWTFAVACRSDELPVEMGARVLAVLGMISVGFLLFVQLTSSPFQRALPFFPLDGRDLNPMLQDFGLIVHPPLLYMGYVGFAVSFALVVAALIGGRLDSAWARWSRPWTTAAWAFLTLGIALGSWWAYYELGWGGWWFWDPVENASFMPWLMGTALMHSLAATEKRGVFRAWTVLLAISTFSLSVLGTFLVRSGVLTSVHAFATDPERGSFILFLLALITGGALLLLVLRADAIRSRGFFEPVSREGALLGNNFLLVGACLVVFTGTLFPLLWDVLDLGKLSVGPPYFNALFAPATLLMMLLLGIGPLLRWKRHRASMRWRLALMAAFSVTLGLALVKWGSGELALWPALTVPMALWIVASMIVDIGDRVRTLGWRRGVGGMSRSHWGMHLGHLGLAMCAIGVAMVTTYSVERDVRMALDQPVEVGPYSFVLRGLENYRGPNYTSTKASIEVIDPNNEVVNVLQPAKRLYVVQQMPMTEVAIRPSLVRDLYIALGEPLDERSWAVRVHYKPFVRWIWLGALVSSIGGFLALADQRYRSTVTSTARQRRALATAERTRVVES